VRFVHHASIQINRVVSVPFERYAGKRATSLIDRASEQFGCLFPVTTALILGDHVPSEAASYKSPEQRSPHAADRAQISGNTWGDARTVRAIGSAIARRRWTANAARLADNTRKIAEMEVAVFLGARIETFVKMGPPGTRFR